MTTAQLLDAAQAAREAGRIDDAADLMTEAMTRPDAAQVFAARYTSRPRHAGTYKATFTASL